MPMSVVYATVNGRMVQENRGGTITKYVADTLGSVIQTRNASGVQTSSTTYWPYGEVRTSTGTNPSPWGFCGIWGYFNDAVNTLYVRARRLRMDLSRWMTLDLLWPNSECAYGYVDNSPLNYIDPTGLLKFVGCDQSFQDKIKRLCARMREMTPKQADQISKCIARTSTASNQTCQPFNKDRQSCLQKFCKDGYVECQPQHPTDPYYGVCPSYTGRPNDTPGDPTGGVIIKYPYGSSNFSNLIGGGQGIWAGRLTFLHEIAHACGVDHGQYGHVSDCQCNDIYACCMFEVLMGRSGDYCVDAMKKYIGGGKPC